MAVEVRAIDRTIRAFDYNEIGRQGGLKGRYGQAEDQGKEISRAKVEDEAGSR